MRLGQPVGFQKHLTLLVADVAGSAGRYQQNQQRATVAVAYTKTQVWELLRETVEQDFRLALK